MMTIFGFTGLNAEILNKKNLLNNRKVNIVVIARGVTERAAVRGAKGEVQPLIPRRKQKVLSVNKEYKASFLTDVYTVEITRENG